jgi:hypothetical protein
MKNEIRATVDFIKAQGGTVKIKHFRAPSVANAIKEGLKHHVIHNLVLNATDSALKTAEIGEAVVPYAMSATFETDSIDLQHPAFMLNLNEHAYKGLGIYARHARGFTVALVTDAEGRSFPGRAICSFLDNFSSNIGAALALHQALRLACQTNSALGKAWTEWIKNRRGVSKTDRVKTKEIANA